MDYKLHETHGHLDLLLQKMGVIESKDQEQAGVSKIENKDKALLIAAELLHNHELFIQPTVSTVNFEFNYDLWSDFDRIKVLIGTHPEIVHTTFDVVEYIDHQSKVLRESVLNNIHWKKKVIGLGECGLDYYYTQDTQIKKKQWDLFESQLSLALELDLPIVIHCRDAFDDLFKILDNFSQIQGRFDIHCFTGDKGTAQKVLERGGFFGIGGIATFNNAGYLRDVIDYIPIDSILIETDLPFLAPVPHRGKDCIPEYIDDVAAVIANIKNINKAELWTSLQHNVTRFYNLS